MGKGDDDEQKKKPKRHRCGACFGEGGEWTSTNGKPGSKPKWTKCRACNGTGWQDD
jgi:DnaJ-class molecular chaperone